MSAALTRARVEIGFWVILLFGLAAGIGIETDWGRQLQWRVAEIDKGSPEFATPALVDPFQLRRADEFLNVTARPLFSVTRRPAPAAPGSGQPRPSMQKGQFVLTGTVVVAEGKFALLIEKAGNKSRMVAEGKQINGITVREVTKERVILSQDDDTEELVLKMNTLAPVDAGSTPVSPGGVIVPGGMPGGGVAPRPSSIGR